MAGHSSSAIFITNQLLLIHMKKPAYNVFIYDTVISNTVFSGLCIIWKISFFVKKFYNITNIIISKYSFFCLNKFSAGVELSEIVCMRSNVKSMD